MRMAPTRGNGLDPQPDCLTRTRRARTRGLRSLLAACSVLALIALACDRGARPPSNPLDESRDTATAAPVPAGPAIFPPAPGTASPSGTSPATAILSEATAAAREKAAGRAIDAIAGWLGVAKTAFTVERVDVVAWPDACLGVTRPDVACAQVITPGERVTLRHRSGETYAVHLGPRDAEAWHPRHEGTRMIASVDATSGLVRLQAPRGSDEMGSEHRIVPGSTLAVPLRDLRVGDRVDIAVAPWPERDAGFGAIVWLIRAR